LQRHEIGPYSKTTITSLQEVSKRIVKERNGKSYDSTKKDTEEDLNSAEDDADWVVKALTTNTPNKKRPFVQPSISIGIGSNLKPSIGLGFEIDFGSKTNNSSTNIKKDRRNVVAKAIIDNSIQRQRRQTAINNKRNSNTDSILDKFRAVAGTDSVVLSRTLIDAYPGDAVPITEAANPNGVLGLARKYGYRDWSFDEDNDNDHQHNIEQYKMEAIQTKNKKRQIKNKQQTNDYIQTCIKSVDSLLNRTERNQHPKSNLFSMSSSSVVNDLGR
jgi:hypothetical protein